VSASHHHFPSAPAAAAVPAAAGLAASAVVLGSDGAALTTITRHTERPAGGPPLVVVAVADDIDQDSAPTLRAALTEALAANSQVCCDVSAVTFFGAAGAHTMHDAHRTALARDARFTVRGARGLTREILEFVGLREVLRPGV
jgi:anti-anti-sigma factor